MFRNKSKIITSFTLNGLAVLPWILLTPLITLYSILLFTGLAEVTEPSDYGMGVIMTTLCWVCLYIFGKRCIRALRAQKFGKYFETCEDGLVSMEKAALIFNMKQQRFFVTFLDCLGKGFLKNCSVFTEDPTFILLENGGKSIKDKFAIVHCQKCGAPGVIRIGFENTCKYCDSIIVWDRKEK